MAVSHLIGAHLFRLWAAYGITLLPPTGIAPQIALPIPVHLGYYPGACFSLSRCVLFTIPEYLFYYPGVGPMLPRAIPQLFGPAV